MTKLTLVRDDDRDELTTRQREILEFIQSTIALSGYPPTLREIGKHFSIRSTNGVNDHLRALEKKGYLQRDDLKSRALRPLDTSGETVNIPILGRVAAGQPILAQENYEDSVVVDRMFIGQSKDVFGLRVKGESMIDDGIFDGDFVFVKKQLQATSGEIVVAMIEDEATVKRYFPEGDQIRFQPANENMQPIFVRKSDFRSVQILGIVIGVYRKF